jgi:hypothetical protein
MNRVSTCIAASITATFLSSAAAADGSAHTEQYIQDQEAAIGQAMIRKDIATLSKLVGDDWTIQNDSGVVGTKAGFINDIKTGTLVVSKFQLHDVRVRVIGDVAIVQGSDDEVSSYAGKDGSGTFNWLDVWEKRNGKWVSIATQLTKVTAKS